LGVLFIFLQRSRSNCHLLTSDSDQRWWSLAVHESGRTRKGKGLKLESARNGDAGSEFVSSMILRHWQWIKAKAAAKPSQVTTEVQSGDTLWSISSRVHGTETKWKELAELNPHIRNPNVIMPNETIRLFQVHNLWVKRAELRYLQGTRLVIAAKCSLLIRLISTSCIYTSLVVDV